MPNYKIVFDDGEEIVVPEDMSLVPEGSGWFGYGSQIESLERHGLNVERYEQMLAEQDGVCAICGLEPDDGAPFHVDHDHVTGHVRGILCWNCNVCVGQFEDDEAHLAAAMAYVTRDEKLEQLTRERTVALTG